MTSLMERSKTELVPTEFTKVFLESVPSQDEEYLKYLLVLISVESDWNPTAVSHKNAIGLMQLTKIAVIDAGYDFDVDKLKEVRYNLEVGSRFVTLLQTRFDTWFEILIAYNGGGLHVARFREGKSIPAETSNFVLKVLKLKQTYCN